MTENIWRKRLFAAAALVANRLRPRSKHVPEQLLELDPDTVSRLPDDVFVEWAYRIIFGREPDEFGRRTYADSLRSGRLTREAILTFLLTSPESRLWLDNREFVPPGHFFSAVPSLADRQRFLAAPPDPLPILDVDLRHEAQIALLQELRPYVEGCPFPIEPHQDFRYYFNNPAYSFGDGLMLHSMIRHFKPKRIIEIGCGHSSTVIMDTNDHFFDGQIDIRFIDPYPQLLHKLMRPDDPDRYVIKEQGVQEVDLATYDDLQENDILFIDSTHVSKLGSDVNRELFDILPRLNPGVLIHFHDIGWPFEYPAEWIAEGRAWNENYLIRAFLAYNSTFEIVLFTAYLHNHPETAAWLDKEMPLTRKNPGGKLWIRKVN